MRLRWPWSTIALTAAVAVVQADLWLGRGNMPQVLSLQGQLAEQQATNRAAEQRNARTVAELADLKEGLEMVEEKARRELGMVKADEILVQYTARGARGGSAAAEQARPAVSTGTAERAAPSGPGGPPRPTGPGAGIAAAPATFASPVKP